MKNEKSTKKTEKVLVSKVQKNNYRGFLREFVNYVMRRGQVTMSQLIKKFDGLEFNGHLVTPHRVRRYAYYCLEQGMLTRSGPRTKLQRTLQRSKAYDAPVRVKHVGLRKTA